MQTLNPLDLLCQFIGPSQRAAIKSALHGEERTHFAQLLADLTQRINTMPDTYGEDGKGDAAVVHLHYFTASADFFITEKDRDYDRAGEGQQQAFGLADLFHDGGELGYISIAEILLAGAELDLYWHPRTLGEVQAERARQTGTTAPTAPARTVSRTEQFNEQLAHLLEAIRAKAEAQFAYNEQTNIPAGITAPEESVPSAIVHGVAAGWNTAAKWSCDDAITLAYEVLEDANCHTEAARLRAA